MSGPEPVLMRQERRANDSFWGAMARRIEAQRTAGICEYCEGSGYRMVRLAWVDCDKCGATGKVQPKAA